MHTADLAEFLKSEKTGLLVRLFRPVDTLP